MDKTFVSKAVSASEWRSTPVNSPSLVSIRNLSVDFWRVAAPPALNNVFLDVLPGEAVGLVGESGSGKSTLGFAIAGLLDSNDVQLSGEILFKGQNLLTISQDDYRKIRGSKIGYIFQDASSSLNPLLKIGKQLTHPLMANGGMSKADAILRAKELLDMVEISQSQRRLNQYPHEISGGMKQRVVIAAALSRDPLLLIADEPTTALDVTVQAQIIDLLLRLKNSLSMSLIFISHDLGVVARVADRIVVMKNGNIIETGGVEQVLANPRESYTQLLLANIPKLRHVDESQSLRFWGNNEP
jgi:ABC-type dipeptide/oligopeptide/nickel transport system ATPase component